MDEAAQQLMMYISNTAPNYVQSKIFGDWCNIAMVAIGMVICLAIAIRCYKYLGGKNNGDHELEAGFGTVLSALVFLCLAPLLMMFVVDLTQWIMYPDACLLNAALKALGK